MLYVSPLVAASAIRNDPGLKFDPTEIPVEAAAADAAVLAAAVTPPPPAVAVVVPVDNVGTVGIVGDLIVGVEMLGTLTDGAEILLTFGKNGIAL